MKDVFDKETLELTLIASNEGIWDWNIESNQIYYSKKVQRFLGIKSNNAPNIMTEPETIIHEDSIEEFKQILSSSLADPQIEQLSIDCKIVRSNKIIRWIRMRGIILREKNTAVRITGSMIDISKRKFAEEMIEEERNMLKLIVDTIPLQVYFKDNDSHYTLVNQRQADWLGNHSPHEVIGKSGAEFFSPESWKATRKEELDIMKSGIPVIDAIQKESWPDRRDTYVQKIKHPWYDSAGKLLGTFGISCDVTKLIEAKKQLERLALDLQKQNTNYQEELKLAKEIQNAILPENSPTWDETVATWENRIHISTLYSPATELAGDFYEVIPISENKVGFLIIDVMGHGVRSAIIVSLIRGIMEQAEPLATEPSLYLETINNELTEILEKASITLFASACYTLLDFDTETLKITNAGHDFPLIQFQSHFHPEKNDKNQSKRGAALGLSKDESYPENIYSLSNIKRLLLFTDGIYEVSNSNDQEWGMNKFTKAFLDHDPASPSTKLKQIHSAAAHWTGNESFQDDVCLISLTLK